MIIIEFVIKLIIQLLWLLLFFHFHCILNASHREIEHKINDWVWHHLLYLYTTNILLDECLYILWHVEINYIILTTIHWWESYLIKEFIISIKIVLIHISTYHSDNIFCHLINFSSIWCFLEVSLYTFNYCKIICIVKNISPISFVLSHNDWWWIDISY